MARYFKVKLGTLWLTKDGTSSGLGCKLTVSNWQALQFAKTGNAQVSASGKVHLNLLDMTAQNKSGLFISIAPEVLAETTFESIVTAFNTALDTGVALACEIQGDTGNFTFNAMPNPNAPISFESFRNGRLSNISINIITV